MPCELEGFRVDNVDICWGDGQNDTVWLGDVLGDQVAGLLLDVGGLITNGHLCQTWQVDQRQVEDVWRVDLEVYGLAVDALVASGNPRRLVLNFPFDIAKIGEPPVGNVMEFGPLIVAGLVWVSVAASQSFIAVFIGNVDELQNEGSAGHDAATAGQKISPHDVFENGGFAGRLGADDNLDDGKMSVISIETRGKKAQW